MSDVIFISVKRWDDAGVRYLHKKSHLDFCKYLPVDYIDPLDWNLRAEDIFQRSDCGRIYTYLAIPRRWKDTIINVLEGYGTQEDGFRYKARKALINLDRVGILHGIADLESQSNNPDKQIPIIHCPKFDASCLFDIKNQKITKFGYIKDEHTVASGSYNVGTGETYTTWAAALADIANLTGNLTFTQQSATTETATSTITESLGGFTFTCTSALDHKGNPNSGYLTSTNLAATGTVFDLEQEGPGTFNFNKLYLKKISAAGAMSFIFIRVITTGCTLNINNNLFDGNGSFGNLGNAISLFDAQQGANIYNNKIWDCYTGTAAGIGILACDAANTIVENNVIINCGSGGGIKGENLAATYKNNLVLTPNSGNCWNSLTNAKGYNNCSTDATGEDADFTGGGSGNISNCTALNEVISVTDTDATFLQVRTDATNANDGGTTVSIAANTSGIEGNPRPDSSTNTYSIGASQWLSDDPSSASSNSSSSSTASSASSVHSSASSASSDSSSTASSPSSNSSSSSTASSLSSLSSNSSSSSSNSSSSSTKSSLSSLSSNSSSSSSTASSLSSPSSNSSSSLSTASSPSSNSSSSSSTASSNSSSSSSTASSPSSNSSSSPSSLSSESSLSSSSLSTMSSESSLSSSSLSTLSSESTQSSESSSGSSLSSLSSESSASSSTASSVSSISSQSSLSSVSQDESSMSSQSSSSEAYENELTLNSYITKALTLNSYITKSITLNSYMNE